MQVPAAVYGVGRGELQVYVYPSVAARERAISALDTTRVAPRATPFAWPKPPTLIVSNNLAAVLLTDDERLVERVQLALTAGLPEPAARK